MTGWLIFTTLMVGYLVAVTAAVVREPDWLNPRVYAALALTGAITLAVYGQHLWNTTT